jgi:biotin operon repressor
MYETQTRAILRMLEERPDGITSLDALSEVGCFRLAARIKDLRDEGHDISSEMVTVRSGKRVARYRMHDRLTLWR